MSPCWCSNSSWPTARRRHGQLPGRTGGNAREVLRGDDVDAVYYLMLDQQGRYLAGDRDLPPPQDADRYRSGTVLFRNDAVHGTPVRVAFSYIDTPDNAAATMASARWCRWPRPWKNGPSWPMKSSRA